MFKHFGSMKFHLCCFIAFDGQKIQIWPVKFIHRHKRSNYVTAKVDFLNVLSIDKCQALNIGDSEIVKTKFFKKSEFGER